MPTTFDRTVISDATHDDHAEDADYIFDDAVLASKPPSTQNESPWNTYTQLRLLERGCEVTTACTRVVPVKMVAMKRHASDYAKELATCRHENLLAVLELYKHGRALFFVVTDYTVPTLKQIFIGSSSHQLQDLHTSAIYQQGRCSPILWDLFIS